MATNNRVSSFDEINFLHGTEAAFVPAPETEGNDDDVLFVVSRSGIKSEKITFKNLASSIVGHSVTLGGDQIISGEKTFVDTCTFNDVVFMDEIIDTTFTGDISGYVVRGETGIFNKLGIGSDFVDGLREPTHDFHVQGDVKIEGKLIAQEGTSFSEDIVSDSIIANQNIFISGSGFFESGISTDGSVNISGELISEGLANFYSDASFNSGIQVSGSIFGNSEKTSAINLSPSDIELKASGQSIKINSNEASFFINSEEKLKFNNEGRLIFNQEDFGGDINISGQSYLGELYITGSDGDWHRVAPQGYDESMNFNVNLPSGSDIYEIDFPKTFGSLPVVSTTLQNQNGDLKFFNLSNISASKFNLKLNEQLENENYTLHVHARTTDSESTNKTQSQSFSTQIIEGASSFNIQFPQAFENTPIVLASLEQKDSYSPSAQGDIGQTFIDGFQYYICVSQDTWRRVTMTESFREDANRGDTDFDNNKYYVCIDETLWGEIELSTSSRTEAGILGDEFYDENEFHVLTAEGWKKFAISSWSSSNSQVLPFYISNISTQSYTLSFDSEIESQYFVHTNASR
jgi:hypothetical protein